MRYRGQNKVDLEDDLSKYVPTFPLQGRIVTIGQLLAHTTGIPTCTDVGKAWHPKWPLERRTASSSRR